jgi:hypothetical protein
MFNTVVHSKMDFHLEYEELTKERGEIHKIFH